MEQVFTKIASKIAAIAGKPVTFAVAIGLLVLWGMSGPFLGFSDTWQLIVNTTTTIVTFLMVFLIQNSQNRDSAAMQAKLDEVIRAIDRARDEYIGIEHLTDEEIDRIRAALERECGEEDAPSHETIARMLARR